MLTVSEAMQQRRSTRSFEQKPVPDSMIIEMLEAARGAPSASNSQPWRFIVVTDVEEKKELRSLCFNQAFIEQAGVVFIVCADLSSYSGDTAMKRRQEAFDAGVFPASAVNDPIFQRPMDTTEFVPEMFITPATANTFIATEHLVLMATALGLGSCWVGAISDREAIKKMLGIPDNILLLGLVTVGYPKGTPPYRPKLKMEDILLRPFPGATGGN